MNRHTKLRAQFNAQIRHRIRIVMAVESMNGKELSKVTEISYPTLNATLTNPRIQPKLSRILRIADALGFSFDALVGSKSLFANKLGKLVIAGA